MAPKRKGKAAAAPAAAEQPPAKKPKGGPKVGALGGAPTKLQRRLLPNKKRKLRLLLLLKLKKPKKMLPLKRRKPKPLQLTQLPGNSWEKRRPRKKPRKR